MAQNTATQAAAQDGPGLEALAWMLLAMAVIGVLTGYSKFPAAGLLLGGVLGAWMIVAWGLYTGGVHEVVVVLAAIGAGAAWIGVERIGYEVLAGMPPFARLSVAGAVAGVSIAVATAVALAVR